MSLANESTESQRRSQSPSQTQCQPSPDSYGSPRPDPTTAFEDLILENPNVCPRCFRRQRMVLQLEVTETELDVIEDVGGFVVEEAVEFGMGTGRVAVWQPTANADVCSPPRVLDPRAGEDEAVSDIPSDWKQATPNPTRYCVECGMVDNKRRQAPLSTADLIDHGRRVAKRLQEQAVRFDAGVFRNVLEDLKRVRDLAAKDNDVILPAAVEHAICAVREDETPRKIVHAGSTCRFVDQAADVVDINGTKYRVTG